MNFIAQHLLSSSIENNDLYNVTALAFQFCYFHIKTLTLPLSS